MMPQRMTVAEVRRKPKPMMIKLQPQKVILTKVRVILTKVVKVTFHYMISTNKIQAIHPREKIWILKR